jgi:hypothetical protein
LYILKQMLSTYRLGDLILLSLCHDNQNDIKRDFPESIGTDYIVQNNGTSNVNIELLTKIVLKRIELYKDVLPSDIENSTVIHVRLGDVVAGYHDHERAKRPLPLDYYIENIKTLDTKKTYIIGKCFFAGPSSRNFDECIDASNKYLESLINALQAEHFDGGNADIDLCCAVKAKHFIQGKGYFSKLIVEIRKKLSLNSIETIVEN